MAIASTTDSNASSAYPAFQNYYDAASVGDGNRGLSAALAVNEVSSVLDLGTSTDVRDDRFVQLKGKSAAINSIFIPLRSAAERTSVFNSSKLTSEDGVEFRRGPTGEDSAYPQIFGGQVVNAPATGTKFPGVRLTARKMPLPVSGIVDPANLYHDSYGYSFITAPMTSGGTDDGYVAITLPWEVAWGPNHYSSVFVGTNSYVTFGSGSVTYSGIGFNTPNLPKICIGSGDNSSDRVKYVTYNVLTSTQPYAGAPVENLATGEYLLRKIFIIYFRGSGTTGYADETINSTNDNLIEWEMYFYSDARGVVDIHVKNMPLHRSRWTSSSTGGFVGGSGFSGANHEGGQIVIPGVTSPVGKGACSFTVGNGEFIRIKNVGEQIFRTTAGLGTINGIGPCVSGGSSPAYVSADACPSGWTDMTNVNTPQAYQYPTFQTGGWLLASGTAAGHVQAMVDPNNYVGNVGSWRIRSNSSGNSFGFRDSAPYEYSNVTDTTGWGARIYWGWGCTSGFVLAATVRYCVPAWSNVFGIG
jgi:hypothetical protein